MYTGVYSFDILSYLASSDNFSLPLELLKEVVQMEAAWFSAQLLKTHSLQSMPSGLQAQITALMRETGRSFEVGRGHPLERYWTYASHDNITLPDYVRLDSLWRIQLCIAASECLKMSDPIGSFRERYEHVFVRPAKDATQRPAFKQFISDVIYRVTLPPDVYTVAQWITDLKKMN